MTHEHEKPRVPLRLRLGAALGAVSVVLAVAALGAAPGSRGPVFVHPAFAQDYRDDHGRPLPPEEVRRREEEQRAREERERRVRYVPPPPPPPVYGYAPPPVYYAPAAPSINLDFIFPLK
jgi:hypothetical protein